MKIDKQIGKVINRLIITFFLFCFQIAIFSQQAGMPFITNYPPDAYKASSQNWAIVQDKRGVMFFANGNYVMEYDGITWRSIKTSGPVCSLAADSTGRIFVGITGDFGYLQPDSFGTYQYQTLKEKITAKDSEFNDISGVFVSDNRVFFQCYEKIFILQNEKIKVVYPKEKFHYSFLINHAFYVRDSGQGLLVYKNDSLQLIAGGEQFADVKIFVMLAYRQDEVLIVTDTKGVLMYAPKQNNKFYKPAGFESVDKFLSKHPVYCGTTINNGSVALGTLTGGIIVINKQGNIQAIYNSEAGLQDNSIYCLYLDMNQQLWAGLDNGISLIQTNLPLQHLTEKNKLKGGTLCIECFNNRLYVGTSQYLYVQNRDGLFETINGTESQNLQLYKINGTLLLAQVNGLFEIKGKQAIPIIKNTGFLNLHCLNNNPNFLLAGLYGGNLCLLEYNQKTWKIKNTIKGFNKYVYEIVQDKEGFIWVNTLTELYKLKLNETIDSVISVVQCTSKNGMPSNTGSPSLLNSGKVIFSTEKGIYRYDSATSTFEQHPDFKMLTGKIFAFNQQTNGDIWFEEETESGIYEKGVLKYNKGNYQLFKQAFYKLNDYLMDGYNNYCVPSESKVFIGANKGLFQYNPMQKVDYNIPYHSLIRKVFAKDSLLFGGATDNANEFENINGAVIPYRQNNLAFHYTSAFYEDVEKNMYSYRLIGSDKTWSDWVSDVKKEYTNLSEGEYTFEVKSKNLYRVIGSTASYSFRILPPWHRTWLAYTLFLIIFIVFIYFIIVFFTRRLARQKEQLEKIILNRTAEIRQQKNEIQKQALKLKKLNSNKDCFITILAHDLKSPFNSILGFLELLTKNVHEYDIDQIEKYINIINDSAKNTFNLLEDILIWIKANSDKIQFHPQKLDFATICNKVIESLKLTANKKNITINHFSTNEITVFADKNMLCTVLRNLISNSIKFTNKNGLIDLYAETNHANITFTVSDNGIGIAPDILNKLFDISQIITTKGTENEKGTGLGLSLCKEFIEKHGGKIWVESKVGTGSKFKFTMPINDIRENYQDK